MRSKNLAIIIALVFLAAACNRNTTTQPKIIPPALNQENPNERFEFAQLDPTFRFSAEIPENLKAEYVSSIESINLCSSSDFCGSTKQIISNLLN